MLSAVQSTRALRSVPSALATQMKPASALTYRISRPSGAARQRTTGVDWLPSGRGTRAVQASVRWSQLGWAHRQVTAPWA